MRGRGAGLLRIDVRPAELAVEALHPPLPVRQMLALAHEGRRRAVAILRRALILPRDLLDAVATSREPKPADARPTLKM